MENNKRNWNNDEDQYLIDNYQNNGLKYCEQNLNRTRRSIMQRARKLNLKMSDDAKSQYLRKYSKNDIENAVENSLCIADVCRFFGLYPQAGNFKNFKKLIIRYNIDISHFLKPSELSKIRRIKKSYNGNIKPLSEILIENSSYDRKELKKRLFKEELLENKCVLCGQDENWRGVKISLILDHINGINNDNRIENLRIVCPNCNATLDTFCSKNRKILPKNITIEVKKERQSKEKIIKLRKSIIPLKDILINDFKELKSFVQVGKKYGVSDNAVRKWCKKYEILER